MHWLYENFLSRLPFLPTNKEELKKSYLNNKKIAGLGHINTEFFKDYAPIYVDLFVDILNCFLSTRILPEECAKGKIKPIQKKTATQQEQQTGDLLPFFKHI